MHAGITPMYRGVHGAYWAYALGDDSNAGVTVHLVDAGIDTGDVLYQANIEASDDDNFTTYPLLQIEAGLPHLIQAVDDALHDNLKPYKAQGNSQLHYHPTIWGYLWNRFLRYAR